MEKQGMDRRKRLFRAGLLIFIVLLAPFREAHLYSNEGDILDVQIETSPSNPIVNSPWSVFILVKHPNPREVNVEPPRFPSSLSLERVRAEVRTDSHGERWTSVEFLFIPIKADRIDLEPFEVKTPAGRALSAHTSAIFREETTRRRYEPRFYWLGGAPSVVAGEKGELFLELINWDPVNRIPQGLYQGRTPRNAILEESLPFEVREGVFRYTITVIPLESSSIKIQSVLYKSDIYSLTIPEITIPVRPARRFSSIVETRDLDSSKPVQQNEITQNDAEILPFPFREENVFFLFNREYKQIIAKAKGLWEEKLLAEALVEIRRNERDSLSGPLLIPLRREIEQMLDLGLTENESWRPLKIPLPLWVVFGFLILSIGVFFLVLRPLKGIQWKVYRGSWFVAAVVLIFTVCLAAVFFEESLEMFTSGSSGSTGKTAVLKATQGYRIPDFKGALSDRFNDGQPVTVGDYMGEWCFAETPDGRSGWVLRGAVILY